MLEAFSRYIREVNSMAKFILVGNGSERINIEFLVRDPQLNDCVEITGFLSQPALRKQLLEADAFILATATWKVVAFLYWRQCIAVCRLYQRKWVSQMNY